MSILKYDPLKDGISCLELVDVMGSDLSVVNTARASFGKHHEELTEQDKKLINFLVKHGHTSPLRSVVVTLRWKSPLYVCRQIVKHIVASSHVDEQLTHNEESHRYVEVSNEFYTPVHFHAQSASNKQCADGYLDIVSHNHADTIYRRQCRRAFETYEELRKLGVAREQARGVLNTATYTSWVNVLSLQALMHMASLRLGSGAQSETREYGRHLAYILDYVAPHTWAAWQQHQLKNYEK